MANLITLLRLLLVFVIAAILEYTPPVWQLANVALVVLIMLLDGLDGIIARMRRETSLFGAVFDIAADRIIEITLWIILLKQNMVAIWVPLIFVTRGVLVDSLRKKYSDLGQTPFSIMRSNWGRLLVAGRPMRFVYGALKLITFAWLLLLIPAQILWPDLYSANLSMVHILNNVLIDSCVIICLARGIPVIIESI